MEGEEGYEGGVQARAKGDILEFLIDNGYIFRVVTPSFPILDESLQRLQILRATSFQCVDHDHGNLSVAIVSPSKV